MVAYSFQARFVAPILAGQKCQTIRAVGRRRHVRAGEMIQLYTGMRTRQCHLIGVAECKSVEPITLLPHRSRGYVLMGNDVVRTRLTGTRILDWWARQDGFEDWSDLCRFWVTTHGGKRFSGLLIEWHPTIGGEHGPAA